MVAAVALLVFSVPVHASKMDRRIESTAKKLYVFKTYLKDDDIKIQSKDGVVTLTGVVSEETSGRLAQETVAGLPGVKSVVNKLEVKDAPPTPNSDAWIREKVKTSIFLNRHMRANKLDIDVKDGIVTLRGNVDTQAQKDLRTEFAKDVDGVKDVNNEMTVTMTWKEPRTLGEKIDDFSITAQVKMTLLFHRSTSALNVSVTTKRGVVTLSGKANNATELNRATSLAKVVNGVKRVRNRMIIE